jgi:hypothetical protein
MESQKQTPTGSPESAPRKHLKVEPESSTTESKENFKKLTLGAVSAAPREARRLAMQSIPLCYSPNPFSRHSREIGYPTVRTRHNGRRSFGEVQVEYHCLRS